MQRRLALQGYNEGGRSSVIDWPRLHCDAGSCQVVVALLSPAELVHELVDSPAPER